MRRQCSLFLFPSSEKKDNNNHEISGQVLPLMCIEWNNEEKGINICLQGQQFYYDCVDFTNLPMGKINHVHETKESHAVSVFVQKGQVGDPGELCQPVWVT
jgi:hypothetical protein